MPQGAATVFDTHRAELGEGPLWHPESQALFWFDILGKVLHRRIGDAHHSWSFARNVSAAGWVDAAVLLVADDAGLVRFDTRTGKSERVIEVEADRAGTRSNDGRADPMGGFWFGTMGRAAEADAGAIYRFYRGELRRLVAPVTIPNAISFSPDGRLAYYADSADGRIMTVPLDADGWPKGGPRVFVDGRGADWVPDGAVVDAEGCLWNAQWGASRVVRYGPNGDIETIVPVPATRTSCPAFGDDDLRTLFVTTAQEGMTAAERDAEPGAGQVFCARGAVRGRAEPRVILE